MKPTTGRIVHYYEAPIGEGTFKSGTGPVAAVVTGIHTHEDDPDKDTVDLTAFPAGRAPQTRLAVKFIDASPGIGTYASAGTETEDFAIWPPRE